MKSSLKFKSMQFYHSYNNFFYYSALLVSSLYLAPRTNILPAIIKDINIVKEK